MEMKKKNPDNKLVSIPPIFPIWKIYIATANIPSNFLIESQV